MTGPFPLCFGAAPGLMLSDTFQACFPSRLILIDGVGFCSLEHSKLPYCRTKQVFSVRLWGVAGTSSPLFLLN